MTSTLSTDLAASIVADVAGGSSPNVDMMIGIGLNKESDAVFFQYMGEDQLPVALMMPSGKPCTRMQNVTITGLSVADEVGEFKATKLNLYLTTGSGHNLMLTSGLTTLWSQYLIGGLMGVYGEFGLQRPITIDTWKGTSKMKPCFAAVRVDRVKVQDDQFKQQLMDAKADRDDTKVKAIMRDAVELLGGTFDVQDVTVAETSQEMPF